MADASDSKSDVGDYVWVQVPSPALKKQMIRGIICFFFYLSNLNIQLIINIQAIECSKIILCCFRTSD